MSGRYAGHRVVAWLVVCGALVCVVGCSQGTQHDKNCEQAQQRWDEVRSRVKLQLATEQFRGGHIAESSLSAREALALNPELVEAYLLLAQVSFEQDKIGEAERIIEQGVEIAPDHPELSYMRGVLAERRGNLDAAVTHYEQARGLKPNELEYLTAEVECLASSGRFEEASALIESHSGNVDDDGTLAMLRAEVSLLLGDGKGALSALRTAVRMKGDDDRVAIEYGMLLAGTGHAAEAIVTLEPLCVGDKAVAPHVVRTLCDAYRETGRLGDAKRLLLSQVRSEPDNAEDWLSLARMALEDGDWGLVRRAAVEVQRLRPDDSPSRLLAGYANWKQGNLGGAIRELREAVDRNPDDELAHCLLGLMLSKGDQAAAQKHFREAVRLSPGFDPACRMLIEPST